MPTAFFSRRKESGASLSSDGSRHGSPSCIAASPASWEDRRCRGSRCDRWGPTHHWREPSIFHRRFSRGDFAVLCTSSRARRRHTYTATQDARVWRGAPPPGARAAPLLAFVSHKLVSISYHVQSQDAKHDRHLLPPRPPSPHVCAPDLASLLSPQLRACRCLTPLLPRPARRPLNNPTLRPSRCHPASAPSARALPTWPSVESSEARPTPPTQ